MCAEHVFSPNHLLLHVYLSYAISLRKSNFAKIFAGIKLIPLYLLEFAGILLFLQNTIKSSVLKDHFLAAFVLTFFLFFTTIKLN